MQWSPVCISYNDITAYLQEYNSNITTTLPKLMQLLKSVVLIDFQESKSSKKGLIKVFFSVLLHTFIALNTSATFSTLVSVREFLEMFLTPGHILLLRPV